MATTAATKNRFPRLSEDGIDLLVTKAVRKDLLLHKKLGNTIAGEHADIPPEDIGKAWSYVPGLPDELNPPLCASNGAVSGRNGRRDGFFRGVLLGSALGAGLVAVLALIASRN